jgi:hypothetical protein
MDWACSTYGERRGEYRVFVGNLGERYNLEDPELDGGMTLNWTFIKWNLGAWTRLIWLRIGTCCEFLLVR